VPARKGDIVRRSLFGPGISDEPDEPLPSEAKRRARSPRATADGARAQDHRAGDVHGQPRRKLERTAVTVPSDLLMRVKDAVAVLNGWPHQYTMARFVEEAFTAQLERLKVEHNRGREFPVTNRKIRTGRPPGT
jgi:hypothetical protein